MTFIPGEIVRYKVTRSQSQIFAFGDDSVRFDFVQFLGEFEGQAVIQDANGRKQLVAFAQLSSIVFYEEPGAF